MARVRRYLKLQDGEPVLSDDDSNLHWFDFTLNEYNSFVRPVDTHPPKMNNDDADDDDDDIAWYDRGGGHTGSSNARVICSHLPLYNNMHTQNCK
jgi:hypothetical protein